MKARGLCRIINCLGKRAQESLGRRKLPVFVRDDQLGGRKRLLHLVSDHYPSPAAA